MLRLLQRIAGLRARVAVAIVGRRQPSGTTKLPENGHPPGEDQARTGARRSRRRRIGPYLIERELGRGAIGTVYLGRHRTTGQLAALKTVPLERAEADGADAPTVRARFLKEARVAADLRHPNIVAFIEAGVAGATGYIAMEPVTGSDLAVHALPGRLLPVATVLRIGQQGARALAHAHRRGVIHRDVKPANLLWSVTDGAVRLTDFGIARIQEAGAWHTRTGQVLGSPAYMAPEQLAGGAVDGRSDLYALGVVLFQLLTGELPHRAGSLGSLMDAIAHQPATDLRRLRPELPEALARLVARLLEKSPLHRPFDGDRVADELAGLATLFTAAAEAATGAGAERDAAADIGAGARRGAGP